MSVRPLVLATIAVIGCRSAPAPAPTTASAELMTQVQGVGVAAPAGSSEAAIAAWLPDVQPVDSGGECRLTRSAGNGSTRVVAYFPSQSRSHTQVTLNFDSAGNLHRFSELRGVPGMFRPSRPMQPGPALDSAMGQHFDARRSTSVSLDFATDHGMAMNRGGGGPTAVITGTVRSMENLEKLGAPKARIQRTRRLCGI